MFSLGTQQMLQKYVIMSGSRLCDRKRFDLCNIRALTGCSPLSRVPIPCYSFYTQLTFPPFFSLSGAASHLFVANVQPTFLWSPSSIQTSVLSYLVALSWVYINSSLISLHTWMTTNHVSLNTSKTQPI